MDKDEPEPLLWGSLHCVLGGLLRELGAYASYALARFTHACTCSIFPSAFAGILVTKHIPCSLRHTIKHAQ